MKMDLKTNHIIYDLPKVRGKLTPSAPISQLTWFRVGGRAEVLFEPADTKDLQSFLKNFPNEIDLTVIGSGSNVIVRDGGISGVTLRLGRAFSNITFNNSAINAYAGAMDVTVARRARDNGIGGLEFLCGIPGSIGGAIRMNAGAYNDQMKDILLEATAFDRQGNLHRLTSEDLEFTYRSCKVPDDWIFVSTKLKGRSQKPSIISARMAEINNNRAVSQPTKERTGGSTFKNPKGLKAWKLIESAGCRSLRRGGAQVSPKHCNFLINTGTATAADIEGLGCEIRRRVRDALGIQLEWEIKRVGVAEIPETAL